jgi:hypothetical protein
MSTTVLKFESHAGIHEITVPNGGMLSGARVFTAGRDARGRFAGWDAVKVTVTARGHWYRSDDPRDDFHNDTVCRACRHHGHFDYILDYEPCTYTVTASDIEAALTVQGSWRAVMDFVNSGGTARYRVEDDRL